MANIVARVNLPRFFLLITILACAEQTLVHAAPEEDFSGMIHQESGNGLVHRRTWSQNFNTYFNIMRRTLSALGAIFTIWIFAETRNKPFEEQTTNDLLEELNLQVENFHFRLEEVQKSLLHLSCLYDASKVQTKKDVMTRNCLQSIQQDRQAANYAHLLTNPSHHAKDRQIKKKSFLPILLRRFGYDKKFQ